MNINKSIGIENPLSEIPANIVKIQQNQNNQQIQETRSSQQSNLLPFQQQIANQDINELSSRADLKAQITEVQFNLKCQITRVGDRVAIVGNIGQLGEWDSDRAHFLETSPTTFPIWTINLALPRDTIIEYKYIIVQYAKVPNIVTQNVPTFNASLLGQYPSQYLPSSLKAQLVIWENFENCQNRRLNTFDKKEIILQEEINNKVVVEEYVENKSLKNTVPTESDVFKSSQQILPAQNIQQELLHQLQKNQQNEIQQTLQFTTPGVQIGQTNFGDLTQIYGSTNYLVSTLGGQGNGYGANTRITSMINSPQLANQKEGFGVGFNNMHGQNWDSQQQNQIITASAPLTLSGQRISHNQSQIQNIQKPSLANQVALPGPCEKPFKPTVKVESATEGGDGHLKQFGQGQVLEELEEGQSDISNRNLQGHPQAIQVKQIQPNKLSASPLKSVAPGQASELNSKSNRCLDELFVQEKPQLDKREPIILASFLLPYRVERDKKTGDLVIQKCFHNPSFMYATLENMKQKKLYNFKWVGLVTTLEDVSDQEKETLAIKFRALDSYPIFMTAKELGPFNVFFENVLRPLFHNFKDLYDMQNESLKQFKDYCALNQKVAQKIVEVKNEFSALNVKMVWIHNLHLLLVPHYVKKSWEQANIGFYFHSPFPSSAHFKIHKFRLEILKSLLHCDLIAFHLFMYARNFFKTCSRLCGFDLQFLKGGYFGVNFHGKNVMIRVSHMGIEESFMLEIIQSKKFRLQVKQYQQAIDPLITSLKSLQQEQGGNQGAEAQRPFVMCAIDSYHPVSGFKNKLKSYQLFLRKYPSYRHKIIFIQFVGSTVQAFDKAEDHKGQVNSIAKLRQEALFIVEEIHQEFGKECLIFEESNPALEKRLALWSQTDIILCSSLKDGLCIQVLEYVACRKFGNKFRSSVMICSEFAGCNEAMGGVLKYNPFSLVGFIEVMDQAMTLTADEKEAFMTQAYSYVKINTTSRWVEEFLADLKLAYKPMSASYYLGINFGLGKKNTNRVMQVRNNFRRLNIEDCSNDLLKSNKGVIIVQIEALPHLKFSKNSIPTYEVIEQLQGLLIDSRNTVIVVGNQTQDTLEEWFGRTRGTLGSHGNQIWIAAESGYLYKTGANNNWQKLTALKDLTWMTQVQRIMQQYADNMDGAFIEQRQSCILFNYKNAEPEHGNLFIHDLYSLIEKALVGRNTEINYGSGYLEVKPQGIKKEYLIELLLKQISQSNKIDFLFYLGNDSSDEPVYELLKSEKAKLSFFDEDCSKYVCVLERKPSAADYYVGDLDSVRPLLEKLQATTTKRKKIRSFSDLTKLKKQTSPFVGQKMPQINKNASIANLGQYMHSGIDLNQQISKLNGPSSGAVVPRKESQFRSAKVNFSASPQVIDEEESLDASPRSRLASKNEYRSAAHNTGDAAGTQKSCKYTAELFPMPKLSGAGEILQCESVRSDIGKSSKFGREDSQIGNQKHQEVDHSSTVRLNRDKKANFYCGDNQEKLQSQSEEMPDGQVSTSNNGKLLFGNDALFLGRRLGQGIKFDDSNPKFGGSEQRPTENHGTLGSAQKLFQSQLMHVETMTPQNNQGKNFGNFEGQEFNPAEVERGGCSGQTPWFAQKVKNCDPVHLGIPALHNGAYSELDLKIDSNSNTMEQHARVKHQPLSSIGLVQSDQYRDQGNIQCYKQEEANTNKNLVEGLSPVDINMGIGSYGSITPEAISMGSINPNPQNPKKLSKGGQSISYANKGADKDFQLQLDLEKIENKQTGIQYLQLADQNSQDQTAGIPDNNVRCQTFGEESRVSDQE